MKKIRIELTANDDSDIKFLLSFLFIQVPFMKSSQPFRTFATEYGLVQIAVATDEQENMANITKITE